MKRKIVANIFLSIGVVLALAAILPVKTLIGQGQPAQVSKMLTKTVSIGTKGITLRFPENWSVGQPTLNSWVILNVPAGQQKTTKPTVRLVIGYLERTDHADAVSQRQNMRRNPVSPQPSSLSVAGQPCSACSSSRGLNQATPLFSRIVHGANHNRGCGR